MSYAPAVDAFLASAENPAIAERARAALASAAGRVHLAGFLPAEPARAMAGHLAQLPWMLTLNTGGTPLRLPQENLDVMAPARREAMIKAAHANARDRFQFLYDMYPISDLFASGETRDGMLADYHAGLNGPRGLAALRSLTGEPGIESVNAWATRYQPGHFLTAHTDGESDTVRLYAYVLNLVPQWRADWGGLLMFYSDDGHVAEAYTPRLGALNIFRVPQAHAVSMVAPFAGGHRYAISGWFVGAR